MKRYLSLDFLRGVTIFGMVFSAIIPYGVLPAWMYHIQNPPPNHNFDMTISGISWVDLVFPIFIFCMGAAIPLAGRRRPQSFVKDTFIRFLLLWLFSYLYVFLNFSTVKGFWPQIATIAGFLSLFPLYYVFSKDLKNSMKITIRTIGVISVFTMIAIGHIYFDEKVTIYRSGIIIFLLAFLYLFGALTWHFTKDNLKARVFVFAAILLFSALTIPTGIQPKLYAIKEIRWFFNMEYIYFLMILLPATYIGDLLQKRLIAKEYNPVEECGGDNWWVRGNTVLLVLFIIWLLTALYKGWHLPNAVVSSLFSLGIYYSFKAKMALYIKEVTLASMLVSAGSIYLIAEGAITKSPCTISYCLITAAISIYMLIISDYIIFKNQSSVINRIFTGAGSNPLMSYIAFGSFIMPLFKITGIVYLYNAAYPQDYPWIGVVRAALAVLLTMAVIARLSERKIFWRA